MPLKIIPDYIKTEDQRDAYIAMVLYLSFTTLFFFYEQALIPSSFYFSYILSKLFLIISAAFLMLKLTHSPHSTRHSGFLVLVVTLFSVIGEIFSPLYFFAYVLLSMSLIFLYRAKPIHLFTIIPTGGLALLTIQYLKEQGILPQVRNVEIGDYVVILFEYIALFVYLHNGYSKSRRNEIRYRERFAIIGQESNIFAHNIKSMIGAQFIINDNIKENITDTPILKTLVEDSERNLEELHHYLNKYNLLEHTKEETIQIKNMIIDVAKLLQIPISIFILKNVDSEIKAIKQDLQSILINILSNAKKALNRSNEQNTILIEGTTKNIHFKIPYVQDYPKGSEIGDQILQKLAKKNNMNINQEVIDRYIIITLRY